ncbi:MAG: gliding motility-associated C-terminal domain-containing protein, partial [Candidatus Kapabacteria bacterium]|nr:gliding motility-associated C-terminal domain-containing protein [Candidatus Kapabacteria bacterium]
AQPQFAQATASDACGSTFTLTFTDSSTNGQCAGSYSVTRTWTATDSCGNTSTASQTINVIDDSAPVIAALPAPSTISCPAQPQFAQATASDACGSTFTLTFNDVTTNGQCAGSYSITRTWTATDSCGNTSTASQTINVIDDSAPVIAALPAPSTISCPAQPQFAQATASDACGSTFTLTFNDVTTNGQCAGSYSVTRTWTATDSCGNTSTASQTINVIDDSAPVIAALPAPSTISCPAQPQFAQATASDACGSTFTLTFNDVTTNGQCAGSYSVTRTWTATDSCGNTSTASQTINVIDDSAPVIAALPAPSTISCPAQPQFAQATASDVCGSTFTLTFNDVTTNGLCAGAYSVTRTWTATDSCGNTSTASQTINVIDDSAPVIA